MALLGFIKKTENLLHDKPVKYTFTPSRCERVELFSVRLKVFLFATEWCVWGMRKRRQSLPKRKLTALGKCRLKATVRFSANDVLFVHSLSCNCALVAAQFFLVNTDLHSFILLSD
jgi:hypothetical protein